MNDKVMESLIQLLILWLRSRFPISDGLQGEARAFEPGVRQAATHDDRCVCVPPPPAVGVAKLTAVDGVIGWQ